MGNPRYRPRDYCDRPEAFGRSPDLRFAPLERESSAKRTAAETRRRRDNKVFAASAQWQHEHALAIRRILHVNGMSIAAYANCIGESTKRIAAMLGGKAVMRHDDVERAEQTLEGVHQLVRFRKRNRMLREIQTSINEIERDSDPW